MGSKIKDWGVLIQGLGMEEEIPGNKAWYNFGGKGLHSEWALGSMGLYLGSWGNGHGTLSNGALWWGISGG